MSPQELSEKLQAAFEAEDPSQLAPLLADDVQWGEDTEDGCHSPAQVIAWFEGLRDRGVRAATVETIVGPDAVILGQEVTWPRGEQGRPTLVFQVFSIVGGRVAEIRGFFDKDEALEFAG